jgi:hypothetical protein
MLPFGAFMAGLGGSSGPLDTETLTVGSYSPGGGVNFYGFSSVVSGGFGSCSDGLFAPKGGAAIFNLFHRSDLGTVEFLIDGSFSDDGWTTMTIDGTPFARAAASFTDLGDAQWTWIAANPFGTSGVRTVVFT